MSPPRIFNSKSRQVPLNPNDEERIFNFRLKRRIVLQCCFSFSASAEFGSPALYQVLFDKAKEAFDRHNIDVVACPLGVGPRNDKANVIPLEPPWLEKKYDLLNEDKLREAVARLHPQKTHAGHLPVIYYPLAVGERYGFTTDRGKWLPYVIIDPSQQNPDGMTLAHEMGHATEFKGHSAHNRLMEPDQVKKYEEEKPRHIYRPIMSYVSDRNRFQVNEVSAFERCYFRKRD